VCLTKRSEVASNRDRPLAVVITDPRHPKAKGVHNIGKVKYIKDISCECILVSVFVSVRK
jgi:hypothetical protein